MTIDVTALFTLPATYDDTTGDLTITCASGLIKEQVVETVLRNIESAAQNKRADINFPISQKGFADNPQVSIVNRTNSDGTASENQREYIPQLVLWYKEPTLSSSDVVVDSD